MKHFIESKAGKLVKTLGLVIAMLGTTQSHARIINGFYSGVLPNYNLSTKVYVQSVRRYDNKLDYYGFILGKNDGNDLYGAVYRITELQNGLQSWVQMFQNEAGVLTTEPGQRPTFAVRTVFDGKSWRSARLQFTVTDFGRQLGCVDPVTEASLRFGFLHTGTWHLEGFSPSHFKIESSRDISAYYDNKVLTGSFKLGSMDVQGDFQVVTRFFDGIGELRRGQPDPEADSGLSETRQLMGIIVANKSGAIILPKHQFDIIEIPSVTEIGKRKDLCFGHAVHIVQD